MDRLRIIGGKPLSGTISISGAKNAALPLMTAALLTGEELILSNVPHLADIATMANLLGQHGVDIHMDAQPDSGGHGGDVLRLNAANITSTTAPYDIVRKMRASVLVLGPLLARFREARVSLPGGCAIGTRPVDQHLKALEHMGATIILEEGYIHATAPQGLRGAEVSFDMVSVGATENALMAATLAKGETVLHNAAREPEVTDLAHCLVTMGADIDGIGTDSLRIQGKNSLHGGNHSVVSDRIEAGSYAAATAIAGGNVLLEWAPTNIMGSTLEKLSEAGIECIPEANGLRIISDPAKLTGVDVVTAPYPGFPTDMQAQLLALLTRAKGASVLTETIFENRFMHVPELTRMGANITMSGHTATVRGVESMHGAEVMATDLRASFSLVIAALASEGETLVNRIYHLDRGYERIEEKLGALGANITRERG